MPSFQPSRPSLRALGVVLGLVALLVGLAVAGGPAAARPRPPAHHTRTSRTADQHLTHRIRSVDARLKRLAKRSSQLDERYNRAAAAATAAVRHARAAGRSAAAAAAAYRAAHARFLQEVTQRYEGGPTASMGTLLTSSTPQTYLDSLSLANYMSDQFAGTVHAEQAARRHAQQAARSAAAALSAARSEQAAVARQRRSLHQQSSRYRSLLGSLTARQQRERARAAALAAARAQARLTTPAAPPKVTHAPSVVLPPSGPVSAQIQRVVSFAEAQVGKSYGWGSAGPYSYDCSGLTMASYAQIGIHLPHSAAGQYGYGTHVAYSQLQPGDLIFLYSPIGHVELYVGHDLAVSAADPAEGIVYVHPSQDMGDYVGATRLVG